MTVKRKPRRQDSIQNYRFINSNTFTKYQSRFRKGYLTPTSFLCVANEWLCNIDKGLVNAVLFHDKEGFWYNRSWDSFYEAKILWASIFIADEIILK